MEYSLAFDTGSYTVKTVTLEGRTITFRAFENIVYVKNPVDTAHQILNLYVPEAYYEGKSIGRFNADNAPIFMPNTVGGYMPGMPEIPGGNKFSGHTNAAFAALARGYVVAAPGARGRTLQDDKGRYTGTAPACIVDLKAAVRYLRHNRQLVPGDTDRIISNGTSAGGALSSLLGASGNHKDYEPYLKELGAAEERDDILAASCYCPITNLEHADAAYEWMYNGLLEFHRMMRVRNGEQMEFKPVSGRMTAEQAELSGKVKALFPAYLNGLGLKGTGNTALGLDADGEGSFKDLVKAYVVSSAQKALETGADLSGLTWITMENGTVTDIDFDEYVQYAARMKPALAFDQVDLSTPENELFGTALIKARHFTAFGADHSTAGGELAEPQIVKMMNPMNYIGNEENVTAQHWRIRHGAVDRDTSLAVPVILATCLQNQGFDVDFALPWGQGHGGDYDLDELFAWMDQILG
ncbi:subtype B tannase [Paenibacillus pinistramenti]|uniref:subtype B tannase n=1 Tax=Paenibacillus pinistramenti TaxID=1768003 RepID=UPI001109C71D|nr:subtype B tannase [Paenibacillus pinistramenti]